MSHPERPLGDGNGGNSGGAFPGLTPLMEKLATQAAAIEHVYPQHRGTADLMRQAFAEIAALRKLAAAAHRAGMLRAAEIAEAESREASEHQTAFRYLALAIRAEAAAGTPPDTERQKWITEDWTRRR